MLSLLCVRQDFQRKRAGTLLVEWGLERAASLALPTYLEASPAGFHLYRKLGFYQIDVVVVRAGEWDGDFDRHYVAMLTRPKTEISSAKGDAVEMAETSEKIDTLS